MNSSDNPSVSQYSNIPLIIAAAIVIINILYAVISVTSDKIIFSNNVKQIEYGGRTIYLKDIFKGTILLEQLKEDEDTYLNDNTEYYQIKDNLYKTYENIIKPYLQMIKQHQILNRTDSMTMDKALNYGIKNDVIPVICACFNDMKWKQYVNNIGDLRPDNLYDELPKEIEESLILHDFNFVELDDFITGMYKNSEYKILEGKFYNIDNFQGNYKNTYTTPVFQGVIGIIETDKYLPHTIIEQRIITSPWLQNNKNNRLIRKKSEEFNLGDKHYIASDDETEIENILTLSLIERLDNLQAVFGADEMRCTFYQNKFIFALYRSNNDFFEPISTMAEDILSSKPLHDGLDNADRNFYNLFDELLVILDIIEELS